jgi:hypothetical protein
MRRTRRQIAWDGPAWDGPAGERHDALGRSSPWAPWTAALAILAGLLQIQTSARGEDLPPRAPIEEAVVPILQRYCARCHGEGREEGGLDLLARAGAFSLEKDRALWERVLELVRDHTMPPRKARKPEAAERARLVAWLEAALDDLDCDDPAVLDPGRVTIRRLNRAEYRNTIRDLTGVDFEAAADFPVDDVGYGFDNIGDNLSLPPLLLEKYLDAAETVIDRAAARPDAAELEPRRFQAEELEATAPSRALGSALSIDREGEVFVECEFPAAGEYVLRARAYGEQAGPEKTRMAFRLDGREVAAVSVAAVERAPEVYEARAPVAAGKRRYAIAYLNNYREPDHPDPRLRGDRNLIVDWFELELAARETPVALPESYQRLFIAHPSGGKSEDACAREILAAFAGRAFRRPAGEEDVERLMGLFAAARSHEGSFDGAIKVVLKAILCSPRFLFRVEADPRPADHGPREAGGKRLLDPFEIASRLSYFLWSSMPDEELFRLAREGQLHDEGVLEREVDRLLSDPRSQAFIENFAGQWLQTRLLENLTPDPALFPGCDAELREAMETETLLFFEAVLREERSLLELIDADFTFVNERLARHYGMDGGSPQGEEPRGGAAAGADGAPAGAGSARGGFRRVSVAGTSRGGLFTQASFLALTSNPTRTSPVKRGKWILEQILGTPPPPPPPDVRELEETAEAILSGPLRERMERHRSDPNCAVCHERMDALGFAFENFDAVGVWRDFDGKFLIDPSGELPDGRRFDGPGGLKALLRDEVEALARNLAAKLLTYALGRGMTRQDRCALEEIVDFGWARGYKLKSLVHAVVRSEPFRMRQGSAPPD